MLTHRWLGVGMCVLFFIWFLSGMVMMYAGHPKLTLQERLAHLPPLENAATGSLSARASALQNPEALQNPDAPQSPDTLLSPAEAFTAAGFDTSQPVEELRLSRSRAGQPIYVLRGEDRTFIAIDARTGQRIPPTDKATALASACVYWMHSADRPKPQHCSPTPPQTQPERIPAPRYLGTVHEDAHTHSHGLNGHRPLHLVQLPDAHDTLLYISGTTGEVVRDAPQPERALNYVGSWLHWLYMFRDTAINWTSLIIVLALIGIATAVTGIVAGLIRWRFAGTYRSGSHSPFAPGMMRWHHILGMVFALSTISWIFSGLMSMDPWDIFTGPESTIDAEAISSERIKPRRAKATPQALLQAIRQGNPAAPEQSPLSTQNPTSTQKPASASAKVVPTPYVVELQWRTVLNKTIVQPVFQPLADGHVASPSIAAITHTDSNAAANTTTHTAGHTSTGTGTRVSPNRGDGRNTLFAARDARPWHFSPARLQGALIGLSPDLPPRIETITRDDFYYYRRASHTMTGGRREHPLPIWRVRYNDPQQTWLHIDPATGTVLGQSDSRARLERWLFALLHSWDLLPLLQHRPLWDIFMLVLGMGGLLLSGTGIWVGVHRSHLKWRSWRVKRARTLRDGT